MRILVTIAVLLSACGQGLPDPVVTEIQPIWGYNGEVTDVEIAGENFLPLVEIDPREGAASLDRQFHAYLALVGQRTAMAGVELLDFGTVAAYVQPGLSPGIYDVLIVTPDGQEAMLPQAFEVTDTRADRLAFDIDQVDHEVFETFRLPFYLLDPESEAVGLPIDVVIIADGISTDNGLVIDPSGLVDGLVTEAGGELIVSGSLQEDGTGWIDVTSSVPDTLDINLGASSDNDQVEDDSVLIYVAPSAVAEVRVDLPSADFRAQAGLSFDVNLRLYDTYGNPRDDTEGMVVVAEYCGSFLQVAHILGPTVVTVTLTGATTTSCPSNWIRVYGVASGVSEPFEVDPGDPCDYLVLASPGSVQAGDQELNVAVYARDCYENQLGDYGQAVDLRLEDMGGGLDPASGTGISSCPGFTDGFQICNALIWWAMNGDQVRVTGSDGVTGLSNLFNVRVGPLGQIYLSLDGNTVQAGDSIQLRVEPVDAFGNGVETDPASDGYIFSSESGDPNCVWDGVIPSDTHRDFTCAPTVANENEVITLSITGINPQIVAATDPFRVENGPIVLVTMDILAGDVWRAGETAYVSIAATDAWGNPYVNQISGSNLDLSDRTGTLQPATVALNSEGKALIPGVVTQATTGNALFVTQGGTALGTSAEFDVVNGDLANLTLSLDNPWVFVGDRRLVRVAAEDAWGNPIPDFAEPVTVETVLGSADHIIITDFSNGAGEEWMPFHSAALAETLRASCSSLATPTEWSPLDVLEEGCHGVTAALNVDGALTQTLCIIGTEAQAWLDAGASVGTGLGYHFSNGDGVHFRTTDSAYMATWSVEGTFAPEVVVYDAQACGDLASARVFVAVDDDQPAGPVDVVPLNGSVTLGDPVSGYTDLIIAARDCAGDWSAGGQLFIRSTLGEITAGVAPLGTGLTFNLNPSGQATLTWSAVQENHGGDAVIIVGSQDRRAMGSSTVTVLGDDALPHVMSTFPQGSNSLLPTQTVSVWFDEAMREQKLTLASNNVAVYSSLGPVPVASLAFDRMANRLDVGLATTIQPATEVYTLILSRMITDQRGNPLEGDWKGIGADFIADFGAVPGSAPNVLACVPDTSVLRPDGDPGSSITEADEVTVTVEADSPPFWWILEVRDEAGVTLRTIWQAGSGLPQDTLLWDARDTLGTVVENGLYSLSITPTDEFLDLSNPCVVEVMVDNALVVLP